MKDFYIKFSLMLENTWIGKILTNIVNSFNNSPIGFSQKKMISFYATGLYTFVIIEWTMSCVENKVWDDIALGTVLTSLVGLITANVAINAWSKKNKRSSQDATHTDDTSPMDTIIHS